MEADRLVARLREAGLKRVEVGTPMARHTSWRIGGPADYLVTVETEEQLRVAITVAREHELPWLVLGGGNNVLVADAGIEGLVILNRLRRITISPLDQLECGAGVFFARAAQYSARQGYTGMEWGISIPGTVGGGVINNAGAHWSDVSQALVDATVIDPAGRSEILTSSDLAYRYRQSALKRPVATQSTSVVTSCRFRLYPDEPAVALARLEELRLHRARTQPIKEASAGSTFKNPDGGHAGALIDRAGLKGHRIGTAQIAPLHANFILNLGGARADDVVALIALTRRTVRERFGVDLVPEVQFVGRWRDEALAEAVGVAV